MNDQIQFFVRECAAHARTLPIRNALLYLRGMMLVCPDGRGLDEIRQIHNSLMESDHQLELIHSGQMKLDFTPKGNGDGQ